MKRRFPNPSLAVATAVALLAALVGGYVFLIKPQRQKASTLSTEIADARAQLEAAQTPGGPHDDLEPIRVADLFHLSRAMPDRPDLPDVLLELSQIADETGITFKSITPADPVPVGSYEQLPISLVFQGHFYDLSDFLYRLRNLVGVHDGELDAVGRLFSVDSVSFAEGEVKFPQVEATLQIDAYVFGNGTGAPAAPAAVASATTAPPATPAPTQSSPTETGSQPIPAAPPALGSATGVAP